MNDFRIMEGVKFCICQMMVRVEKKVGKIDSEDNDVGSRIMLERAELNKGVWIETVQLKKKLTEK